MTRRRADARALALLCAAALLAGCSRREPAAPPPAPLPAPPPMASPAPPPATSPARPPVVAPEPPPAAPDELGALAVPVAGVARAALRDTFLEGRPGHPHEAIDIAAERGTPVLAAGDGRVVKLFTSVPGGLTIYQLDAGERYYYYYAHLDRYADGLREGMTLRRCDVVGYVGTTGNARADAPHLHFAVFAANAAKEWWKGSAVNPYRALSAPAPGC